MLDSAAREFVIHNGPSGWLRGLGVCPPKLASFASINEILCHRPWLLSKDHIHGLLDEGEDAWSVTELVQAIIIAVTYHSLSSFVWALGISFEQDLELVRLFRLDKLSDIASADEAGVALQASADSTPRDDSESEKAEVFDLAGWLQARLQQAPDECKTEEC